MKFVILCVGAVLLTIFLGGCETQAQRQFQAIRTGNQQSSARLETCTSAVFNSAENAPLRPHAPYRITDLTLQQLSDVSLATAAEIQAIYVTHPKIQECRREFLDSMVHSEPSLVPIYTSLYAKQEDQLIALIQHKNAWGDYVRHVRDLVIEARAGTQAENRRVVTGLQQEHQTEMAQRQQAAEAFAAWAQTQQLINAANRPVITNCNGFGSSINCISH
jgi:hypothetical protein